MIGLAPKTINKGGNNYSSCGYYLYIANGTLYSQKGDSNKSYSSGDQSQGTVYGVKYNKGKGTVTYYKNGQSMGVAYTGLDKKVILFPAFDFDTQNGEIEFVKPKFK